MGINKWNTGQKQIALTQRAAERQRRLAGGMTPFILK